MGGGFSAVEFRQGAEPVVLEPSSVHRAGGGGRSAADDGPEESPRTALRRGGQRYGTGRRVDPHSPARRAENGVRTGAANTAGDGRGAVWLHAGGVPLRRAAARRYCAGIRPNDGDSLR